MSFKQNIAQFSMPMGTLRQSLHGLRKRRPVPWPCPGLAVAAQRSLRETSPYAIRTVADHAKLVGFSDLSVL